MAVCPLHNDSSETIKVIVIKRGTVTASDMRMYHVLIILTFIFMQGHTDLNHGNNKCSSIISETVEVIPIKFAVKIVRLKVCMTSPMTLLFTQCHKCVSDLTNV